MNSLDSAVVRLMIKSAAANLRNKKKSIDDLNVFPVPDGDTGTNMSLTFSGADAALADNEYAGVSKLVSALASMALRNARGNSGVILSQIIRGFSKGVEGKEKIDIADLKDAMVSSSKTAYRAVMKPTEGTILTVVREISEFAENNYSNFSTISEFLHAAYEAGKASLENTPNLLPALKEAGVVDAGGMGVMVLFEGFLYALDNGEAIEAKEAETAPQSAAVKVASADIRFMYCTEFIINKTKERKATQLRSAISEKGDCMLVIDDDEIVKVHIHTNHPGFVIEEALKLGELTNLKIDNMKYQHNERIMADEHKIEEKPEAVSEVPSAPQKKYGFAVVSAGSGLSELFESLNADEIIEGGQTMNPSTQELLNAVEKIPAENVFILPNNKNIILAAEQVNELSSKAVTVIPTVNIPEGISALMVFDESLSAEENAEMMKESAAMVSCGQVTYAARSTVSGGVEIKEGDAIGVIKGDIEIIAENSEDAAVELAEKLITEETAVVSVYYGENSDESSANSVYERLGALYPELDISLHFGGQPVYNYIISAE